MSVAEEDERLPWLEAVEDQDGPRPISTTKIAVGAVIVVLGLGILGATTFMLGRDSGGGSGAPELIAAADTPYKVRPDNPGGLDLSEDSGTAHATSVGEDPDAQLDTAKLEAPAPRIAVDEPAPAPAPAATPAVETAPSAAASGPLVQLGAYSSRAKAETGWALLSSRFTQVAAMEKVIQQATVNGNTVYRLRARAADADAARTACNALDAAGEACVIVN